MQNLAVISHTVRRHVEGFKSLGRCGPPPWDVAPPRNTLLLHVYYYTKFLVARGQTVWA